MNNEQIATAWRMFGEGRSDAETAEAIGVTETGAWQLHCYYDGLLERSYRWETHMDYLRWLVDSPWGPVKSTEVSDE